MILSYKSVYNLLDQHYARRSLNGIIAETGDATFKASLLFAIKSEDYDYMSVVANKREEYSEKYVIFISQIDPKGLPIILEANKDLDLQELVPLMVNSHIDKEHFIQLIESQCESKGFDSKPWVSEFEETLQLVEELRVTLNK